MDLSDRFQNALLHGTVSIPRGMRPASAEGEPVVVAGRDALVTRLRDTAGNGLALRIPAVVGGGTDWTARYTTLTGSFQQGPMATRLPGRIAVVEDLLPDADVPAVLMEWIDGPTLLQAVHRASVARNTAVLTALAAAFRDAINDLRTAGFHHGDLVADNIIIRPTGRLAFVDLDTASWPHAPFPLAGRGTPGYRHPAGATSADSARDAFATLVIYVSLRLLAAYPELRSRYGDPPDVHGGCLLFSAWDLADPVASRLFAELERTEATRGAELDALRRACLGAPDDASALVAVIPNLVAYRLDGPPTQTLPWGGLAEAPTRDTAPGGSTSRLRGTSANGPRRSEAPARHGAPAVEAPAGPAARSPGTTAARPRPPMKAGAIGNAMWRERLRRALEQRDEPTVARLWPEVQRDPLAHMMALDVDEVLALAVDRRIDIEARRRRDDSVQALLRDAATRGLVLSPESRQHGREAAERMTTRLELERALTDNDREALADLAVSGRLVDLGEADRAAIRTVLRALDRPILERALRSDDDALILLAYDGELFGAGALTAEERTRIELAQSREGWLQDVRAALKRRDAGKLAAAFVKPPPGAEARLSESARRRAYRLIERERALDQLAAAVAAEDEPAILVALNTVERVGARVANRVDWPTLKRVVDRATLVEEIQAGARATPVDYGRLAHLIPSARALGLATDPRLADLDLAAVERYVLRAAHVRRLRAALARDDDAAIAVAATPDPHDAVAALDAAERTRVDRALTARRDRLPFST